MAARNMDCTVLLYSQTTHEAIRQQFTQLIKNLSFHLAQQRQVLEAKRLKVKVTRLQRMKLEGGLHNTAYRVGHRALSTALHCDNHKYTTQQLRLRVIPRVHTWE